VRLIGTELYQQLLAHALHKARGDALPDQGPVELHLGVRPAVPADYVPEPELRLGRYRRLAALASAAEVDEFQDEVTDRFGPPPEPVHNLIAFARLRQRCRAVGIARLEAGPKGIAVEFRDRDAVRQRHAAACAADAGLHWRGDRLVWSQATAPPKERMQAVEALLTRLERSAR
jgi:transcription-repair coupling factor (superfamily II helicase)